MPSPTPRRGVTIKMSSDNINVCTIGLAIKASKNKTETMSAFSSARKSKIGGQPVSAKRLEYRMYDDILLFTGCINIFLSILL